MFRIEDLDIIRDRIPVIQDKVNDIKLTNYEPKLTEYETTYRDIYEFIKTKKVLVYGGWAQNAFIKEKNQTDAFYGPKDFADIEFYYPEPVEIAVELADYLDKKGYKNIQVTEGVHEDTYKIFANFHNYCDITFMDKNIYDACPFIELHGMRLTHPNFMLVDFYRVFADPMFSYWRLDKSFNRFIKLYNYYPFYKSDLVGKVDIMPNKSNIIRFIRKKLLHKMNLVVIGHYAYNYLVSKVNKSWKVNIPYYQVISTNFDEDKDLITEMLKKEFKEIYYEDFFPFFQFTGKRREFYHEGKLALILYDHNNRCTVYQYSKKKLTNFGTYGLTMLHLVIDYNMKLIFGKESIANIYKKMICNLVAARNAYLDKHNIKPIDPSPFEEFTTKCMGKAEDPLRLSRLKLLERKKNNEPMKFNYSPGNRIGKKPKIQNTSGLSKLKAKKEREANEAKKAKEITI